MRIRLKTLMAGPEGVFEPGSVLDIDPDKAGVLLSAGYAEPLERPVETAAFEPGNRAVKPIPRPRKTQ